MKKGPYTITSSKEVYKNPWIKVTEDSITHPDENEGIWATFDILDGVAVLPIDDEGNVYIGKGFRYAVNSMDHEVFSGGIDKDESPLEAVQRELKEESGIEAKIWTEVGTTSELPSYVRHKDTLFIARDLSFGESKEEPEEWDVLKMSLNDAVELVMNGTILDAKSQVLILKAHFLHEKNEL